MSSRPAGTVRPRSPVSSAMTYGVLTVALLLSAFPIYWTFLAATSSNAQISASPPRFLPGTQLLDNVQRVFENRGVNFGEALVNSLIVSMTVTIAVLLTSSMAGFAFAKLRFRGRGALLIVVVATMMIPAQLGIIPLYILMGQLEWNGTLKAVTVPFLVSAFGVFFMRQFIEAAIPTELIEAARVDGASTWRTYLSVVLPAIRPGAAVLGLLTFMATWNDFLWPLVTLNPQRPTVQVALNTLASGFYQDYSLVLTGTALATLPLLIVFIVFGRQIIDGIMEGAVKS